MKDFKGKVAVVTGAASGIGLGLAERCAKEGMKVVLADIEENALARAEKDIKAMGVSTLAVCTDVSKADNIECLARKTLDAFGEIHLLCNNAGVDVKATVRESTLADWRWVLGVNLWGVINGIHFFTPIMIKQGTECHIVNTASMAGLYTDWCGSPYTVSKHAIIAISEILYRELEQRSSNIGVSVLCPGPIGTNLVESARNRPVELYNKPGEWAGISDPKIQSYIETLTRMIKDVMSPQQVADITFNAIKEKKFYILANAEIVKLFVKERMRDIIQERNPTSNLLQAIKRNKTIGI
jgi:NAD(P)-dependent dehydrogenase (short-subunit alcohol dehydrogenase family)